MSKKKTHYVKNADLYAEVMKCQEAGKVSDTLANMYMLMARRYATKPNFASYSYIDEAISLASVNCCAGYMKFDGEKYSNAFAYFTSIIHNSFIAVLNSEKNQQRIRDAMLIENGLDPSYSYEEA